MKHLSIRVAGFLLGISILLPTSPIALAAESAVTSVTVTAPASVTIGNAFTVSAAYSGEVPTTCSLFITKPSGEGISPVTMVISTPGSPATIGYNLGGQPAGIYSLEVQCSDSSGIARISPTVFINASSSGGADSTAPTITSSGPTTATAGTAISVTAAYSDAVGVTSCDLYVNSVLQGSMSIGAGTSGTASRLHTFSSAGTAFVEIRCRDAAGNIGVRNHSVTVSAASVVTSVTYAGPTSVTLGNSTTFSASFIGAATACSLRFNSGGIPFGEDVPMTLSGTSASVTFSPTAAHYPAGTHQVRAVCYSASGGEQQSSLVDIVFSAAPAGDAVAPVISTLSPSTATVGSSVTISANYSDAVGVTTCQYFLNGVNTGSMSLSGSTNGTATRNETFEFAGSYTVEVRCYDAAGNSGTRSQIVTASTTAPSDSIAPSVSSLAPVNAVAGTSYAVTAVYSDAVGVTACDLYIGGSLIGGMTLGASTGGTVSRNHTFSGSGSIAMEVRCRDAAGNFGNGVTSISVTAASTPAPSGTDTTAPTVGPVSPNTATRGTTQTYSVSFADASYITNCTLYVQQGSRYVPYVLSRTGASVGYASHQYTFFTSVTPGNYNMYATCTDERGNVGTGPVTSITVSTTSVTPTTPPGGSYYRQLVKLRCPPTVVDSNHACKAIYYVSSDGKRHAFPNERAYFTWYADFNTVYELDSLSTFPLGANVTYRPGIRLVKFTTLDRVYAVGRNGLLRWITSETAARALYGSLWNRQIDDISDAFYTNYRFGTDINTTSDFNPAAEAGAVLQVDQNF
ncbi:hypothetical protein IPH19_03695 [Candidatus Uhrbacteria bacterium]|nr:MAG: hypothetical protein IPH19_03695 [Candidatus Uhrbacteria bacterium]